LPQALSLWSAYGMHSCAPVQQPSVQLLSGQVDPQSSPAPWHLPAQSGVQPSQPVWVHSSPAAHNEPVAAQTQESLEQESDRASAVQSAQIEPPVPQVVADGSRQVLPSQQPSGQVCEVHSCALSPQEVRSKARQTSVVETVVFTLAAPLLGQL
jgi:hypothetical protein